MPNRIQPSDKIGPNNAGKMILRGCFMNVSQDWLEKKSGPVGVLLAKYLDKREGEATAISLNYGDGVPGGRERGAEAVDVDFMTKAIFRLTALEKTGVALESATPNEVQHQVFQQIAVLEEIIEDYTKKCKEAGLDTMFTAPSSVIIGNVSDRTPATHAESLKWEPIGGIEEELDLFAGLTIHGEATKEYEPPTFIPK